MDVTIENCISLSSLNCDEYKDIISELDCIIISLRISKNEAHLRKFLKGIGSLNYFKYGFDGSYVWVNQRNTEKRILKCEF